MSDPPRRFPAAEEHRYFLEIELVFNQLRGSASLLSPADWQIARDWWKDGIPLSVVRSALENVFAGRRERGEVDRIKSLRYCRPAVENAFRQLRELGYGSAPEVSVQPVLERLEALVARLGEAGERHGEEIRACAEGEADAATVERRLADLEVRLAERRREELDPEPREALDREVQLRVERSIAPLRSRLDPQALEESRRRLRAQWLRRLTEVPRLSLF